MSNKKIDLPNLKRQNAVAGVLEPRSTSSVKSESVSPFFSPIQTRNQRKHLKIKYEKENTDSTTTTDNGKKVVALKTKQPEQEPPQIQIKKEIREQPTSAAIETKKESKKRKSNENKIKVKFETNQLKDNLLVNDTTVAPKQVKWEPKDWEKTLENLRIMRLDRSAPVDTMGCHKCSDKNADEKTQRFHHLIALMLSSQTKDQTTFEAMKRLKADGLTPQNMVAIDVAVLEKRLCPVSFYKTKAKNIQRAAQILIDQYDSDIPPNVEELIKLPGVGPKMAHICMHTAWNIVSGIGVDTHVHRISNRLKWVSKTKGPEQTRAELEKWIPYDLWSEINEILVGFGQIICTPVNPKCDQCLNYHCPSRSVKKK